jgi:hypothetical protein
LRKLAKGLDISLAAIFRSEGKAGLDVQTRRIHAKLHGRSTSELRLVEAMLTSLLDGLDEYKDGPGS